MRWNIHAGAGVLLLSITAGIAPAEASDRFPPPECETYVAYDRDMVLPGYLIPSKAGAKVCVPFTTVGARPPADYKGDFYVDEFAEPVLRARWLQCKADPVCAARVSPVVNGRKPPNREKRITDPHHRHLLGKIDENADLAAIRRPAFFGQAPYREPIAAVEASTYAIEFTAPAEAHERIHKGIEAPVKLRGWYMEGRGVPDAKGRTVRALIVMSGGGGTRLTAIDHPEDRLYSVHPETRKTAINAFPNARTGSPGQAGWRSLMAMLNAAGFDVLAYDRRGVGVSSGYSDTNTLQQGRDLLAALASLRSGEGMRALSPKGRLYAGADAARALRGKASELPTLLLGNSRGTMATGWAMTMNFDKDCSYDLPEIACTPPRRDPSIKGAMLMAEFTSGPGFVSATPTPEDEGRGLGKDRGLFIGASQIEHNIVFFPGSAILAGMKTWPAAFFARGLWDYAASLEGTIASYDRVPGLKELVVVRGPHPFETWPEAEKTRVRERLRAFALAAIRGAHDVPGARPWTTMKDLVATTEDVWEASSAP
ncbi:hypothetical protein [Sphingosinicella sp.]|uniref:hypothetical protein n=1 Tax=Sphingosinicella sp. TaxID=1917971 RepID=UPI0025D0E145|nr:hypothetical protein [Sphingosinicella sp.]